MAPHQPGAVGIAVELLVAAVVCSSAPVRLIRTFVVAAARAEDQDEMPEGGCCRSLVVVDIHWKMYRMGFHTGLAEEVRRTFVVVERIHRVLGARLLRRL